MTTVTPVTIRRKSKSTPKKWDDMIETAENKIAYQEAMEDLKKWENVYSHEELLAMLKNRWVIV